MQEDPYKIPKKRAHIEPDDTDKHLGEGTNLKFRSENKLIMCKVISSEVLLPTEADNLISKFENLVLHSSTNSTWKKHNSAWNSYKKFSCISEMDLPLKIENVRAYVTWALTDGHLKPSTVESYLSSISLAHSLAGFNTENFAKDKCIQLLLKGSENVFYLSNEITPSRLAMNIHLLKLLSHRINATGWEPMSKQIVWTACTVCFYCSCRMGEILSENKSNFDPKTTLKWQDIRFLEENEIIMYVPYTKTTGLKGAVMNIFPTNDTTCPVAALTTLKTMRKKCNSFDPKKPVFQFKSGIFLTVKTMNELLEKLLKDFNSGKQKISCHSFRAAIPSAIASHPDKITVEDVKEWGQ